VHTDPSGSRGWQWMMQYDRALDFAVAELVEDGLLVPPFDKHPTRVGVLQKSGLTAAKWTVWSEKLAARVGRRASESQFDPSIDCDGSAELKAELRRSWQRFAERDREQAGQPRFSRSEVARTLRPMLNPSLSIGLPPLRICWIHYPGTVQTMPSPDVSLVSGYNEVDAKQVAEIVTFAAEQQRAMHSSN
jgi:hypothetical protein